MLLCGFLVWLTRGTPGQTDKHNHPKRESIKTGNTPNKRLRVDPQAHKHKKALNSLTNHTMSDEIQVLVEWAVVLLCVVVVADMTAVELMMLLMLRRKPLNFFWGGVFFIVV